jgi:hypothetical protein
MNRARDLKHLLQVYEQNIRDISTNDVTKPDNTVPGMMDSIFASAYIDWQMRNAGYSDKQITQYWNMRKQGASHEDALNMLRPDGQQNQSTQPELEEINMNDSAGKQRATKALSDKVGSNHADVKNLSVYLHAGDAAASNNIMGRHDVHMTFIKTQ